MLWFKCMDRCGLITKNFFYVVLHYSATVLVKCVEYVCEWIWTEGVCMYMYFSNLVSCTYICVIFGQTSPTNNSGL